MPTGLAIIEMFEPLHKGGFGAVAGDCYNPSLMAMTTVFRQCINGLRAVPCPPFRNDTQVVPYIRPLVGSVPTPARTHATMPPTYQNQHP